MYAGNEEVQRSVHCALYSEVSSAKGFYRKFRAAYVVEGHLDLCIVRYRSGYLVLLIRGVFSMK